MSTEFTVRPAVRPAGRRAKQTPVQTASGPAPPPGSETWLHPFVPTIGSYGFATTGRQYGSRLLVEALAEVAAAVHSVGLECGVGDLSLATGGPMPPHAAHRDGRHADLRPLRKDGGRRPTSLGDPMYSRRHTRILVEALRSCSSVTEIRFNDSDMAGVRYAEGHHNHLHIEVR